MITLVPMTDAEIAALAELERRATNGDWHAPYRFDAGSGLEVCAGTRCETVARISGSAASSEGWYRTKKKAKDDAAFIAAARNAVPRLHATIAADRAEIERLREALDAAEACMSIVEPRSDKAEYLRTLGVVRAALKEPRHE